MSNFCMNYNTTVKHFSSMYHSKLNVVEYDLVNMKTIHPTIPLLGKDNYAALWLNSPQERSSIKLAKRLWNESSFRICTDGAANIIMPLVRDENCAKPTIISGDFDSITTDARKFFEMQEFVETSDQDRTDMCKALQIIADKIKDMKLDVGQVIILGGLFGRFDHVLSSMQSLLRFKIMCDNCEAFIIDGFNLVTVLREGITRLEFTGGRHLFTGKCGIVPFVQRETIATSTGLKWNLDNRKLAFEGLISTSNELVSDTVSINNTAPVIFTLEMSEIALS